MKTAIAAAALAALLPAAPLAEERATTKEAEGLVKNAVGFLKKEGKPKAFAAFDDPRGPFTYRDLYIMVYDYDGKCVSHGQKKDRIGKSLIADKDPDGKPFVRERVALVKAQGKAWQEYKFMNPATKKVEQKVAYCEGVEGVIVCSGAYKP
ncbi:MAG TPA: cache domain-containing protein [Anaeromyxobacteraceae bacterium]